MSGGGPNAEHPTVLPDLVTWLRAQLDEDEQEINRHPVDTNWTDDDAPIGYLATAERNYPCEPMLTVGKAFALAEVDVKRRIIDLHRRVPCSHDRNPGEWDCEECGTDWPCETVGIIGLPYADRPGYDERWRP